MTGSLAPPPPYGSEQGSILLEAGREGAQSSQGYHDTRHGRSRSGNFRHGPPTSPGPVRSPTDISLAHLVHVPTNEEPGEPSSAATASTSTSTPQVGLGVHEAPPEYTSPTGSDGGSPRSSINEEQRPLLNVAPIPSYADVVVEDRARERSNSQHTQSNSRRARRSSHRAHGTNS